MTTRQIQQHNALINRAFFLLSTQIGSLVCRPTIHTNTFGKRFVYMRPARIVSVWGGKDRRLLVRDIDDGKIHKLCDVSGLTIITRGSDVAAPLLALAKYV